MMGSTEPERRWAIQQGAQQEWVDWEKPQHRVAIAAPIAIGKHAVTRGQFATFVEAAGHDMSGGAWIYTGKTWEQSASADWCAPGFEQTDRHPVVCVSWNDAKAYLTWLSKETGQPSPAFRGGVGVCLPRRNDDPLLLGRRSANA